MESVTIFPEAFVALPWGNLYEEHKIGGQPAFIWQQAKLFETSYNTALRLKSVNINFRLDAIVNSAVKLLSGTLCATCRSFISRNHSVCLPSGCDVLLASSCVNSATDGATDELHCITITDIFDTNIDSGANTDCKLTVRRRQVL